MRSDLTSLEERVEASERNLYSIMESITDGVIVFDADGEVAYANRAADSMLAPETSIAVGRPADVSILSGDAGAGVAEMKVLATTWEMEPASLVLLHDVTARRVSENEVAYRATHDPLTGLPNRWLLSDRLDQALARMEREHLATAILYCDLDRLKSVNDHFGHVVGDAVLVETAKRLKHVTRHFDTVARMSGDEFVIVCESVDEPQANSLVERIMSSFREPLMIDDQALEVGISVGFVLATDPEVDALTLLSRADQAMFESKRRNRREEVPPLFL